MTDEEELQFMKDAVTNGRLRDIVGMAMDKVLDVVEAELAHFVVTFGVVNHLTLPTAMQDIRDKVEKAKQEAWGQDEDEEG